ncbi:MAG: MarR family transcriptional regulator [bacterium]
MDLFNPIIGADLLRLTSRCRDIDKHLATSTGLTIDEIHCLSILHIKHPTCVKELNTELEGPPTRTSRALRLLEEKGFVCRSLHPNDRRREQVVLTETGRETAVHILSLSIEVACSRLGINPTNLAMQLFNLNHPAPEKRSTTP